MGTYGSQNAQFNMPWGMKVDMSENLFIVDSGNSRIQIFDLTGNYIGNGSARFWKWRISYPARYCNRFFGQYLYCRSKQL